MGWCAGLLPRWIDFVKHKIYTRRYEMKTSLKRFIRFIRSERSKKGQDFPEYALILGTVAVVALAVLAPLRQAIITAFNFAISALQAAVGG